MLIIKINVVCGQYADCALCIGGIGGHRTFDPSGLESMVGAITSNSGLRLEVVDMSGKSLSVCCVEALGT